MTGRARPQSRARLLPRLAAVAPVVPAGLVFAARPALAAVLGSVPGWRAAVERGMAAALGANGYEQRHVEAYFRHLADLIAFSLAVYRRGIQRAGLDPFLVHDPASLERYRKALAAGRGALMVCPHLIGHEIMAGSIGRELPLTVLVRPSPDPAYEALKRRWYAALGVEVVHRPGRDAPRGALAEMTAALRALRRNRVLALTPDLVQPPGKGVSVRLFGKPVELPAGPFFLAVRTGAPLLPSFFHEEGGRYRLWTHEPLPVPESGGVDRREPVRELAQQWAARFEEFLRRHPDMWQFWLDKRWAAWLGAPLAEGATR